MDLEFNGVPVTVVFDYVPREWGTFDSPGNVEEVILEEVYVNGVCVNGLVGEFEWDDLVALILKTIKENNEDMQL